MQLGSRLKDLARRRWFNPRFLNVSFLPLPPGVHPAFLAHVLHLQDRTALPWLGKHLHVINRKPTVLKGYPFVAEVENLFALLPKPYTHSPDFNIRDGLRRIEAMLARGQLRRILFQSQSQYDLNRRWFTPAIERAATMAQIIPHELEARTILPADGAELRIILIGSAVLPKGLFLVPGIVRKVRARRPDIRFTLVCAHEYAPFRGVDGLEIVNIPRDREELKYELLRNHQYFLNLSLGDALGVFLECARYNLPMISYPGQHGPAFVPPGAGVLLEAPWFSYEPLDFDRHYNLDNHRFAHFLEEKFAGKASEEAEERVAEAICGLRLGEPYARMVAKQHEFSRARLSPEAWLGRLDEVYSEL